MTRTLAQTFLVCRSFPFRTECHCSSCGTCPFSFSLHVVPVASAADPNLESGYFFCLVGLPPHGDIIALIMVPLQFNPAELPFWAPAQCSGLRPGSCSSPHHSSVLLLSCLLCSAACLGFFPSSLSPSSLRSGMAYTVLSSGHEGRAQA